MSNNLKAISPLIATILLVVVAVALISIVLTWGKGFTNDSLSETTDITKFKPSDVTSFLDIKKGLNGRFFVKYRPPNSFTQSITITHYSLLGLNRIPLEPNVTIAANTTQALDLGIVDETFDLVLYLDNNTIISKIGVKTENRAPSTVDCPTGYIPVPGNFLYDTTNGNNMGFCVAKYEMKVDTNSDGIGDINTSCDYNRTNSPSYHVWYSMHEDCNVSQWDIVSTPEGYPITGIAQNYANYYDSKNACASLGSNYHLITNEERMTIARNLERVSENWSSGEIGTEDLYSGHNDNGPSYALEADSNDDNGYYLTTQTSGPQRRTLKLTNNQYIWDFSGNVREWVDKNITEVNQPDGYNMDDSNNDSGYAWFDYSSYTNDTNRYINPNNLRNSTLNYKDLFLIDSTYNANNGVGRIYTDSGSSDPDVMGFVAGGDWSNGSNAGILDLVLYGSPSYRSGNIGFRCSVVP